MILLFLMSWLNAWSERNHHTLAFVMIQQCDRYATNAEAEWWSEKRERLESLKIAASQLGWFRPANEIAPWEAQGQEVSGKKYTAGFLNVVRMRRLGVIPPDGLPE